MNISQRDRSRRATKPRRQDRVTTSSRPPRHARALAKRDYVALAGFRAALRRFLRVSSQGARAAGVTPQQHQLLLAVRGRPGRDFAVVGEVAQALGVSPHAAVGLIDRSSRAGLVTRTPSSRDRRQVEVRLTTTGERVLARVSRRNRAELGGLRRALDVALLEPSSRRVTARRARAPRSSR